MSLIPWYVRIAVAIIFIADTLVKLQKRNRQIAKIDKQISALYIILGSVVIIVEMATVIHAYWFHRIAELLKNLLIVVIFPALFYFITFKNLVGLKKKSKRKYLSIVYIGLGCIFFFLLYVMLILSYFGKIDVLIALFSHLQ